MLYARHISAAALALAAMTTAAAAADGKATLTLGTGNISNQEGNAGSINETNATSLAISGYAAADLGAFTLGIDVDITKQFVSQYSQYEGGTSFILHGYTTLSNGMVAGAFLGGGSVSNAQDSSADMTVFGIEGAFDLGTTTVAVTLGGLDGEDSSNSDVFHNATFLRVKGVYALGDDAALTGALFYAKGKQDSGASYDMTAKSISVGYERAISGKPLSYSVGLEAAEYTNGDSGDNGFFNEVRLTAGISYTLGGKSVAESSKAFIFDSPDYARIISAGNMID